jgi:hypothetical protein
MNQYDHPVVSNYEPTSNKGLFLCGKAQKPQRIGLLKKFYETNTLDHLVWSFYNPKNIIDEIRNDYFAEYSNEEFEQFLNETTKILDYKQEYHGNSDDTFVHYGFPYDVNLYKDTAFSIINESCVLGRDYQFTEKTWRAIANKHPFIMVGAIQNVTILKNMGFRTFENYLKIQDYHTFDSLDDRLNAIVVNTREFSKDLVNKELQKKLREDVEYNFNLFIELAKKDINDFLSTIDGSYDLMDPIVKHHHRFGKYRRPPE